MYKNSPQGSIIRIADGASIPCDLANKDYQDFLDWQQSGGKIVADIDENRTEQIAILTNAYNTAIQVPVAYMNTTFQADEASQAVLTKVLVAGSVPVGFAWLDANNTPVNMTYAQLQGLAVAMLAQGQAAFVKLQTLKSQVRAATTVTKAQAVVW